MKGIAKLLYAASLLTLFHSTSASADWDGTVFKSATDVFQNEQYAEAAKLFRKAVAMDPKGSAGWYFLGESLTKSDNMEEAQCAFARALELQQTGPVADRMRDLLAKHPPNPVRCIQLDKDIAQIIKDEPKPQKERLESCEPNIAIGAAEEIVNNPDTLKEPLQLFSPAAVLFQHGKKDEAVFWFYAAQLRVRYQLVFEKGDRGQLLAIMMMTVGAPINNYAFQDVSNLSQILDRVLKWDESTPNSFRIKPRAENADKQIEQIYAGFRDLQAKIIAEKDQLEQKARQAAPQLQEMNAKIANRCRKSG